ncbi:hypothetical protein CASFOL_015116 [Castilleja foliolosa]|uniref:Uncharacterized protein n=1 Tax=Castilleja foliolosa TaxID=1961234 RepID=A0ABD3DD75_9LAMI
MATALLAKRAPSSIENTSSLFRCAFGFIRNLSAATPTNNSAASAAAPGVGAEKPKPKRKKKKNLFEVAQFLPNWGLGYHMAKTHWTGVSYEITKINLYKDGRHGKAWGIVHKDGFASCRCPEENKWGPQALLEIHPELKKSRRKCPEARIADCLNLIRSYKTSLLA